MGFDVFGKSPVSETGRYFRRTVWTWHPLWNFVEDSFPGLARKVRFAHSNDGDGLNAEDSSLLSSLLLTSISFGDAARYVKNRDSIIANTPPDPCTFCENGITTAAIAAKFPAYTPHIGKTCIQCEGKGFRPAFSTNYSLTVEDIRDFALFLKDCGGFEIC